jgi:hypothetical protein
VIKNTGVLCYTAADLHSEEHLPMAEPGVLKVTAHWCAVEAESYLHRNYLKTKGI